jgi:acetyl esterase/lipase
MKKGILMAFLLWQVVMLCVIAQPVKIKLWPNGAPGSKPAADYVEKSSGENGNIARVEKVSEPELSVFLPKPEIANGTVVLIIPGGGYVRIAVGHEGYDVAKWLNTLGIAGVVLKYRLPSDVIMMDKTIGPLQDAQEAMRVIRRNADKWKINPQKVGVLGFSAGGHLAATISTHYAEKVYEVKDDTSARPDFSVLVYPVITMDESYTHMGSRINLLGENPAEDLVKKFSNELQVNAETPPAFLVHSSDDRTVPSQNSIAYYLQLQKNKIPTELHIFQKGGHGYGLAVDRGTESGWPALCASWLKAMGFL